MIDRSIIFILSGTRCLFCNPILDKNLVLVREMAACVNHGRVPTGGVGSRGVSKPRAWVSDGVVIPDKSMKG